ncbi:hypothetical protein [Flavobacterium polysaccharolyticum]|uniref:Nuclear transport factor 2 family protein n=1 Tax=Flavobacterium polysaccharolyticum TaxID=3133148 RepID=A0ABU9NQ22_9FLAO
MKNVLKNNYKIIFFTLTFHFAINCFGQEKLSQNDIDTLYVKALQQRMDLALSSGYKYIDIDNQTNAPQTIFTEGQIKILNQDEIIKISRKENKEFTVYTISHRIISKDTVDINFGEYKLKGLKKKGENSPLAEISECKCGVVNYKPDVRFVLINNKWKIIESKFIKT